LHYACGFNHLEIAKMLIDEGAKLEVMDSKGNTPLHYAAGYGRPQLVSAPHAVGVESV
jgi:ankyrin repeat protein